MLNDTVVHNIVENCSFSLCKNILIKIFSSRFHVLKLLVLSDLHHLALILNNNTVHSILNNYVGPIKALKTKNSEPASTLLNFNTGYTLVMKFKIVKNVCC